MSLFWRKDNKSIDRRATLNGVPVMGAAVRVATAPDGSARLKAVIRRGSGFLDRFRPPEQEKDYELDRFGAFVVGQIDGQHRIVDIVGAFEQRFKLSRRESELGVVAFLKMLMQRRLIAVYDAPPGASSDLSGAGGPPPRFPLSERSAARGRAGSIVLALCAACATVARAEAPAPPAFEQELAACLQESRAPGMAGNLRLQEYVQAQFAASSFTNGALRFQAPCFVPGATRLTLAAGEEIPLQPLHPTLMRPGNFPERSFRAPLLYLGRGTGKDLRAVGGKPLRGALALMEFDCGDRWMELLRFGVRGFVFLGAEETFHLDACQKLYNTEVSVPRFYVDLAAGQRLKAECLRTGSVEVDVTAEPSRWESRELRSPWVFIPGTDPDMERNVVMFTAALDANSVVPDRAYGGQSAGNLFLLLSLLESFRERRPACSTLLVAVNAHTQKFLGERILSWHLLTPAGVEAATSNALQQEMLLARLFGEHYGALGLEPATLDERELDAALEVLWPLYRKQQEQRRGEWELQRQERAQVLEQAEAEGVDPQTLQLQEVVAPDADLNLDAYTEEDFRAALRAALQARQEQLLKTETRWFIRRQPEERDLERVRQLDEMRDWSDRHLQALLVEALPVFQDERRFEDWRTEMDWTTGKRVALKSKLQEESKRSLNMLKMDLLALSARHDLAPEEKQRQLDLLNQRKADMTDVLVLFNKIDIGGERSRIRYRQIAGRKAQWQLLREYRDRLVDRYSRWAARKEVLLEGIRANGSLRQTLAGRPVSLAISLDANWAASRVGFCTVDAYAELGWQRTLGELCARIAGGADPRRGLKGYYVDALTRYGGNPEEHYFQTPESAVPYFHAAGGTPALALKSVFSAPGRAFGPDDTWSRIDPIRARSQREWLTQYLSRLISSEELWAAGVLRPLKVKADANLWSCAIRTCRSDDFSAKTVPDVEVPGSLVALYRASKDDATLPFVIDAEVVNVYGGVTDETGLWISYGMNDAQMASLAYQLDTNRASVVFAIDKGQIQESLQMNSTLTLNSSKVLPMFPCLEFPVYDRMDPAAVSTRSIAMQEFWPMSAEMRSAPQKYGVHGVRSLSRAMSHASRGPAAVMLWKKKEGFKPERLMLITADRRCALNPTAERPEGEGYLTPEELGPDVLAAIARDMDALNRHRLAQMKGVANELVDGFLRRGREWLDEAGRRLAALDYAGFREAQYRALGSEVKAYGEIRTMNRDMLQAVILYMALLLPFCFFLEKLLFSFTKLEHELFAFFALFVGTYVMFRLIHPAFAIAMNPEAIFIAFVLGAVGCFMTYVLRERFHTEMQMLFRTWTGMEDVSYGTVGQTAMLIGVNNMKRRRVRTSLTCATIVLVVFTMLCFSSVSKTAKPTLIRKASAAPYTGLFYRWPGGTAMDEDTARVFQNLFDGRADVSVRRILQPGVAVGGDLVRWRLDSPVRPERAASVEAVLGLPQGDRETLGSLALRAGKYFSAEDAREILMPGPLAEALGLGPEDVGRVKVRFLGQDLTLAGIVDEDRYRLVRDLDPAFPLLPRRMLSKGQSGVTQTQSAADDAPGGEEVDSSSLVILPAGLAEKLGAKPFTISVRVRESAPAGAAAQDPTPDLWGEVQSLLGVTSARFYVGSREPFKMGSESRQAVEAGVYYVSSSYRTAIGGLSRLLIPLLIAGLIVFNTMLGTVHERKSEIAVYNAIGLNPTHIFLFFLAEAMVYSVVGAVGGYLIGQVLAILLQSLGWVSGINVNFSSLIVVYAILFTMGLVLLSTLYPAWVATRTAVPSGRRSWSMPKQDGRRMNVAFPFIYQPTLAPGVIYYLFEYFSGFAEGTIGDQIMTLDGYAVSDDANGRPVFNLTYSVALAPFDLGVTQKAVFVAQYDPQVESYRLHVEVERLSGQDTDWVTVSRPFLERLRKILIRWRNVDPAQHGMYVQQGRLLFFGEEPEAGEGNLTTEARKHGEAGA